MGIRVSYGNRSGIADAIASGLIPKDSFIIGTYSDDEAELLFQDKNADLRHLVAQTRFDSAEEAIQYAISHEYFTDVLVEIDDYERYCETHPEYRNNRAVLAIANIKRVYKSHEANSDFLK